MVVRPLGDHAAWSVVLRSVQGGMRRDHLVKRGVIPCGPGSAPSREWWTALYDALMASSERPEPRDPLGGAEAGAPLGGLQGELG